MCLFFAVGVLDLMQDFIALIDAGSNFLLAREAHGVVEVTDDAPILEMQLGREIKLDRHAVENVRLWQRFLRNRVGLMLNQKQAARVILSRPQPSPRQENAHVDHPAHPRQARRMG
jgi:hypothetical protein